MNDADREHYRVPGNEWRPGWTVVSPNSEQVEMIARIENEFASDGPNKGMNWIQAEMLDNHEPAEVVAEGAAIGRFDRWQDVPDGLLARTPTPLTFLDDAGLRFYLPAIMRWVLRWGLHWSAPPLESVAKLKTERSQVLALLTASQHALFDEWNYVHQPDHLRLRSRR